MKGKSQTIHESIRIEAYLLSEKAGHPGGMEHYFWTQAEAIVHARAKVVSKAVKAAAAKPAAKRTTKPKPAAMPKAGAKPSVAVKPKAAVKAAKKPAPKATIKPPAKGTNGKAHQLSLSGELAAPPGKRRSKR